MERNNGTALLAAQRVTVADTLGRPTVQAQLFLSARFICMILTFNNLLLRISENGTGHFYFSRSFLLLSPLLYTVFLNTLYVIIY